MSAGFCQTLVDTPFEVLKINKIMNIHNKFLYKGFIPHCTRNIIFLISVYNFREYSKKNNIQQNIFINSLYGGIGGVFGAYISHPFDTIKTRIQSNQNYKIKDYFNGYKKGRNAYISSFFIGSHLRASMSMVNMFVSLSMFELFKILNIF